MNREQLCDSLITWLKTFGVDSNQTLTIDQLNDGVVMSAVLHQIAPTFFNEAWMMKIKQDVLDNKRLKVNNLKKILKGVLDYYNEVLGQQLQGFDMPNVNFIAENGDRIELSKLLQLILGCAIHCDAKEDYIQSIMSLQEEVQHNVMNAIKELMTKEVPTSPAEGDLTEQLRRLTTELSNMTEQKEEMAQRCQELDLQVVALQEEKASLTADNERLNERVNASDSIDDPRLSLPLRHWPEELKSTPIGRRYQQLSSQLEQLQEEMYRIEAARDDYRVKVDVLTKEAQDLQQKNEELSELAEQAQSYKDEIDVLSHNQDKLEKYETSMETYKKKLEEMRDLKTQMKILEEKNTSYMQTNLELEEELRKSQSVRTQMEVFKRQQSELQTRCSEETRRADRAEFEYKRTQEKLNTLQREKERLMTERDSLRESNEELRCTQVQKDTLLGEGSEGFGDSDLDLTALPTAVREKFLRLQHENKMLRQDRNNLDDNEVLQGIIDDAQKRSNDLQSELRISNQRIMELEAQVEDLTDSVDKSSGVDQAAVISIQSKMKFAQQTVEKQRAEIIEQAQKLEENDQLLSSSQACVEQLRQQLSKKDDEMKAMDERYKQYLEKAKSVIQTLDPQNKPGPAPEVQALRNQMQEKDRLIDHLEKDHEKARQTREQEEKLMVTAWYNLGLKLHRQAAEARLERGQPAKQSFLARQRQAHTRRTSTSAINTNSTSNAR